MQQQPQRPNNKRKKLANRAGVLAIAAACAAAAVGAGPQTARAIVVATPRPGAASPLLRTPHYSTEVPLDASLFFVLDGTISSRLKPGTVVRAHLRDPLVLGGMTIAAAGSPVDIEVYQTNAAHMGNEDGSVDIYFQPLHLADGKDLPLITPTAHIDPHVSVGQYNTQAVTDTIGDIFIPGHYIYHILRKGRDVVLGPGTVLRARTSAKVTVEKGAVVLATPQPFVTPGDTPHPAFVPAPMYTPPGFVQPTPKPSPSAKPTSTP